MYDTILVPTDGSDHAARAADHGFLLARAFDATVHLVSVVDVRDAAGPFDAGGVDEAYVDRLEAEAETALEELAERADGVPVERAVLEGKPRKAILEYATDVGADLIAMGTHGRSGVRRVLAGSVTEHVVRHADLPVLTARVTEGSAVSGDYEEILVPTDGSTHASAAVDHAVAIADRVDARVHAVNVVDVVGLASSTEFTFPTELFEQLQSRGEEATGAVADRAREAGLEAVTEVREGSPAKDLLRYAEENEIDLVAMGTAGLTGLDRFLLGSTTERLLRHAEVPVLAVSDREE